MQWILPFVPQLTGQNLCRGLGAYTLEAVQNRPKQEQMPGDHTRTPDRLFLNPGQYQLCKEMH